MLPIALESDTPPTYLLHGLSVRSEVEIDAPTVAPGGAADIEIRWGSSRHIPNEAPAGSLLRTLEMGAFASWLAVEGGRYTLRTGGWCDFEFDRDLSAVDVHLPPGTDGGRASVLMANLLSNLLVLGGRSIIHASAIEFVGGAVAFVGDSGRGKSTVATLCCAAGARLVSDDVLRVEVENGDAWCYRGSLELRLRQNAAALAGDIDGAVCRTTSDGRVAVRPPASASDRLPMAAVVTPICEHQKQEIEVVRLRGLEAALELIRHPRTSGWLSPEPARRDLQVLTQLADRVPIYRAHLPWGPPFQPDLGARFLAELRRLGLGSE
jgi:hypothetical protein